MTELPPPTQAEPVFRHNWLYSVVPAFDQISDGVILLAGYCKVCDQAFAKHIPWDSNPDYLSITKMNIPKWGCVDPNDPQFGK